VPDRQRPIEELLGEIRNSKSEIRNKLEGLNPNVRNRLICPFSAFPRFELVSDFALRASDFSGRIPATRRDGLTPSDCGPYIGSQGLGLVDLHLVN